MSVISSWTVTPNRLALLVRYLSGTGDDGLTPDALAAFLVPGSLARALRSNAVADDDSDDEPEAAGSAMVDELLREGRTLGLLEETDGRLRVPTALRSADDARLLAYLDGVLTVSEHAEAHGQRWFPLALAWFLAQDPAASVNWSENPRPTIRAQCPEATTFFELGNRDSLRNFGYWARYLGYAVRQRIPAGRRRLDMLVPDPTRALVRHLTPIFAARPRLAIDELLAALAECTDVFEGGVARRELEALWTGPGRRRSSALSGATSVALGRLARRGLITLDAGADAALTMDLASWPTSRRVSHVVAARG